MSATIDPHQLYTGNDKLTEAEDVDYHDCKPIGTILHVSVDGEHLSSIIADMMKDDAKEATEGLRATGVKKTVMLTATARRRLNPSPRRSTSTRRD